MDKYTKVKVLGKGSFGSATLIKRKKDGLLFVVKEVNVARMSTKEREEARNEVKILSKLSHPNIVRYIEHSERRGTLFIVMEYADGGDLHQKIKAQRNTRMKETTILHYFAQIALALDYLHSMHILHRDIKAMNVFLTSKGTVKLGDFGISTVLRNTMGMANTVCGTPYYFSPELCRNKPYNNKTDVWAAGILLYELAALKHPFDGNSMNQLMQRIVKSPYPPLPLSYSQPFRDLVRSCLEKEHARRPTIRGALGLELMQTAVAQLEEDLAAAQTAQTRLQNVVANRDDSGHGKAQAAAVPSAAAPVAPVTPPPRLDPRAPRQVDPRAQAKPRRDEAMQQIDRFLHDLDKPVHQVLREREQQAAQHRAAEEARQRELAKLRQAHEAQLERERKARGQAAAARLRKQDEERKQAEAQRAKHLAELKRVMEEAERRRKAVRGQPRRADKTPSPQKVRVGQSPQRKPQEAFNPVTPPQAAHKRPTPGAAYVAREERPAISQQEQERQQRDKDARRGHVAQRAQNWVAREQQRKQNEAELRRREEADAVRNLERHGANRPGAKAAGSDDAAHLEAEILHPAPPSKPKVPPMSQGMLDPELAAWVHNEGKKKDHLASPAIAAKGARKGEGLRRSIDDADRVLRQQGYRVQDVGPTKAVPPRSMTPPPSPARVQEFSPAPAVAGPPRAPRDAPPVRLEMDPRGDKTLWQRRAPENGGAEPVLQTQVEREGRPKDLSQTRPPQPREHSAPPVMSPVRTAVNPGVTPSPGKEMVSTVSFQEVPARDEVDARLQRRRDRGPDEFSASDESEDDGIEEDAMLEANERSNVSDDANAEYDAMRSHIKSVLQATKTATPAFARAITEDVVDETEVFGDDAPMSPGFGNGVDDADPEEDHLFRLAHLCGDKFTGAAPTFLDGKVLVSADGDRAPAPTRVARANPGLHTEMLRGYLGDVLGLEALVAAYKELAAIDGCADVDEHERAAIEQTNVETAKEIVATALRSDADTNDTQDSVSQYLALLCQLVYFDEEMNRDQG